MHSRCAVTSHTMHPIVQNRGNVSITRIIQQKRVVIIFFVATFVMLDACFVSFAASIQAKFYKILCCAIKVQIFTNIIIMSRKKYEYRVENINDDNMGFYDFIYEVERILNKHGENGWELDKMENYGGRTLLILRREIG